MASFFTNIGNTINSTFDKYLSPGLVDLRPLRGLSGLSFQEQNEFKQAQIDAGILSADSPFEDFDRLYKNGQYISLFGEDKFDKTTPEERDRELQAKLVQPLFEQYYKGNVDDDTFARWNTLTPVAKQEMLENVLNDVDFHDQQEKWRAEEGKKLDEQYGGDGTTTIPGVIGVPRSAVEKGGTLFTDGYIENSLQSKAEDRDKKIQDLIDKDKLRRLDEAEPFAMKIYDQWKDAIDNGELSYTSFEDQWKKIADGDGDENPGLRHWKAFKDEEELADFTIEDKMKALAKYEAMRNQFGKYAALESLDADIQNHIAANQDGWDKTRLALWNIATGTVATLFGEVNGLIGFALETGLYKYLVPPIFLSEALGITPETDNREAFAAWLNSDWKRYWDGVDQFNTFSPDEINRARENGGVSPYQRIRGVGDEHSFDYNTVLDMAQMAKFIIPALVSKGIVGKVTEGLTSTGGFWYDKAWNGMLGVAGALESGVGIADAYASGTYDEVLQEGNARVDSQIDKEIDKYTGQYLGRNEIQQEAIDKASNYYNDKKNFPTLQKLLDSDEMQEKLNQRVDDYFNNPKASAGMLDTPETRQQMKDKFAEEELKEVLKEKFLMDKANAFVDALKPMLEERHAEDRHQVLLNAADAYAVNATTEVIRMAAENALFRKWMLSEGTKKNLGMNGLIDVEDKAGKGLSIASRWKNRVKPVVNNVWGGFESNYMDDVTARFGKEYGLTAFDNYMAKHYDPQRYIEAADGFWHNVYNAAINAKEAFGEEQSFWDGFIGAGGSLIQGMPSFKWMSHLKKENRTAEAKEALAKRSWAEKVGDYFYNPILQEVGEAMARERATQERLDNINKSIADNEEKLGDFVDMLGSNSDHVFGLNSGDMMAAADSKAWEGFTVARMLNKYVNDPMASKHHVIAGIMEKLNRTLDAKSSEDISDIVDQYLDNNKLEHTEENAQEAFERIKKNAESLQEIMDIMTEANKSINKTRDGKILSETVRNQLLFQRVMDSNWKNRQKQMLDEVGVTPGMENTPVVRYGNKKVLEDKIEAQKTVVSQINEKIKQLQEQFEELSDSKKKPKQAAQQTAESSNQSQQAPVALSQEASQQAPQTSSETSQEQSKISDEEFWPVENGQLAGESQQVDSESADYENEESGAEAKEPYVSPRQRKQNEKEEKERKKILLSRHIQTLMEVRKQAEAKLADMYDAANKYYEESTSYDYNQGDLSLLTADDILNLSISDMAYMLDPENRDEYNSRQQVEIQKAESILLERDPEALSKIKDAARLNERIERNRQSYARLLKSPIVANLLDSYMQEESVAGRNEYLFNKYKDDYYQILDVAYNQDALAPAAMQFAEYFEPWNNATTFSQVAANFSVRVVEDWYKDRGIPVDKNVIDLVQTMEDAVTGVDLLGLNDTVHKNLIRSLQNIMGTATTKEDAIAAIEQAIDDIGDAPESNHLNAVLAYMSMLGYQRDATTLENRKQRKEREEADRIAKEKQRIEEEKAKAAAEAAAKTAEEGTDNKAEEGSIESEEPSNKTVKSTTPFLTRAGVKKGTSVNYYTKDVHHKDGSVTVSITAETNGEEVGVADDVFLPVANLEVNKEDLAEGLNVVGIKEITAHPDGSKTGVVVTQEAASGKRALKKVRLKPKEKTANKKGASSKTTNGEAESQQALEEKAAEAKKAEEERELNEKAADIWENELRNTPEKTMQKHVETARKRVESTMKVLKDKKIDLISKMNAYSLMYIVEMKLALEGYQEDLLTTEEQKVVDDFLNEFFDAGYSFDNAIGVPYNSEAEYSNTRITPDETLPEGSKLIVGWVRPFIYKDGKMVQSGFPIVVQGTAKGEAGSQTTETTTAEESSEESSTGKLTIPEAFDSTYNQLNGSMPFDWYVKDGSTVRLEHRDKKTGKVLKVEERPKGYISGEKTYGQLQSAIRLAIKAGILSKDKYEAIADLSVKRMNLALTKEAVAELKALGINTPAELAEYIRVNGTPTEIATQDMKDRNFLWGEEYKKSEEYKKKQKKEDKLHLDKPKAEEGVVYGEPFDLRKAKSGRTVGKITKTYTNKDGHKVTEVVGLTENGEAINLYATIPFPEEYELSGGYAERFEERPEDKIVGVHKIIEHPRTTVHDSRDAKTGNDIYREQDAVADVVVRYSDGSLGIEKAALKKKDNSQTKEEGQSQASAQEPIKVDDINISGQLGHVDNTVGWGTTLHFGKKSFDPRRFGRSNEELEFVGNILVIPANIEEGFNGKYHLLYEDGGRQEWEGVEFPRELTKEEQRAAIDWVKKNGNWVKTWKEFAEGIVDAVNNASKIQLTSAQESKEEIPISKPRPKAVSETAITSEEAKEAVRRMFPEFEDATPEEINGLLQNGMQAFNTMIKFYDPDQLRTLYNTLKAGKSLSAVSRDTLKHFADLNDTGLDVTASPELFARFGELFKYLYELSGNTESPQTGQIEGNQNITNEVSEEGQKQAETSETIETDNTVEDDILNADNALGEDTVVIENDQVEDNGDTVSVYSSSLKTEVSESQLSDNNQTIFDSSSVPDYSTANSAEEHAANTDTSTMPGNAMSEFKYVELSEHGQLIHKKGKNPGDSMNNYFDWMKSAGIYQQNIIDRELSRILRLNPRAKVHFISVRPSNNATHDMNMNSYLLLALDYDNSVNRWITQIHSEENGGVIEVGGKKYLIVGTAGYNNNAQNALFKSLSSSALARRGMEEYFYRNPSERFFVAPVSTEIVSMSVTPGYVVRQLENDYGSPYKNVSDLLTMDNGSRNPANLTFETLVWGIQEYTQFALSNPAFADRVMVPRNKERNLGSAFFLVPAGNGKFVPGYLKPLMYNEMHDGQLKQDAINAIRRLVSPKYVDRRKAAIDLGNIFYLHKDGDFILVGKDRTSHEGEITLVHDGVERSFILNDEFDIKKLFDAFKEINPRVNITLKVLRNLDELKKYDEAGALQTDLAMLHTAGSSYRIYSLDSDGNMNIPAVVDNPAAASNKGDYKNDNRVQIPYHGQYYLYDVQGGFYYLDSSDNKVTDAKTIRDLEYNKRVNEAGLSPIKKIGVWDLFILGTGDNAEVIRRDRNNYDVVVAPTEKAKEIIEAYLKELDAEKRNDNAAEQNREDDEIDAHGDYIEKNMEDVVFDDESEEAGQSEQIEEEGKKKEKEGKKETPIETQRQGSPVGTNHTNAQKTTATFQDLSKNQFFITNVLRIISKKWKNAPTNINELAEFLRTKEVNGKRIEVDAIGTTPADLKAWMKTLDECR